MLLICLLQEGKSEPSAVATATTDRQTAESTQPAGISKSKSMESDANSLTDEDTAPLLLN